MPCDTTGTSLTQSIEAGAGPDTRRSDVPRPLAVARVAWAVTVGATLILSVVAFLTLFDRGAASARFDQGPISLNPELARQLDDLGILSDSFITAGDVSIRLLGMLLFTAMAAVLVRGGGREPRRLVFSAALVLIGASLFAPLGVAARAEPSLQWLVSTVGVLSPADPAFWRSVAGLGALLFLLVFPDGRFVPRWSVWVLGAVAALSVLWALFPSVFGAAEWPGPVRYAWSLGLPGLGLAAQAWRYTRVSTPAQRRQTRLVLFALSIVVLSFALLGTLDPELEGGVGDLVVTTPRLQALYELQLLLVLTIALFLFPVSIAVSVLRYRLLDVDVVVNRAVLYGVLAGFIGAVYVAVVVVVGRALGTSGEPNAALTVATLVIVAVAFDAVRRRVERFADRLVYGERATPYEMLSHFSHRMAGAVSMDDVLPWTARATARATGGRARVRLFLVDGGEEAAVWPSSEEGDGDADRLGAAEVFPVAHQGQPVGEVEVVRPGGDPLSGTEREIVAALADQAGPALHNASLYLRLEASLEALARQADELLASRRRIQSARDDAVTSFVEAVGEQVERRLEVACSALREACAMVADDQAAAMARAETATQSVHDALDSLRELARGVYPPALADRGVLAALRARVELLGPEVHLDAGDLEGRRFSRDIEAAAYFCGIEAVQVLGRAGATVVRIGFGVTSDDEGGGSCLTWEVRARVDGDPRAVDIQAMVDRVGAWDGSVGLGTAAAGDEPGDEAVIVGRLPAEPPEE